MKQILLFLLIGISSFAQNDSINLLDEVKLYGNFSKKINSGYKIQIISDSIVNGSVQSLGDLLEQKANLYFKQNGHGMISSISLRGTGASHTGVYWNGIAINSTLNGQTDFNSLVATSFDEVVLRKGAGTALFGSGAIGGAINLKDKISFKKKKHFLATVGIGSYHTKNVLFDTKLSTRKYFIKLNASGEKSTNDYPYLGTTMFNENGKYSNEQVKAVLAYKINQTNKIQLFTNYSNNYRELSRTISAPSKNLYKNKDTRVLVNWLKTGNTYNSNFKVALLNESYKFYLDKDIKVFSFGKSSNFIVKYDFNYMFKKNKSLTVGIENKFTEGEGTSIIKKERNIFESFVLFNHILDDLTYNLSVRKGFSNVYDIPLIFATDLRYDVSKKVNIRANYSTNYKLPTFNDLYWEYAGNENLQPEDSKSAEIGVYFQTKKLTTSINAFLIESENLIQWKPVTATFWRPINVQSVTNSGIEVEMDYLFKLKKHKFRFQTQYAYTRATDNLLEKQLMYVPYHKASATINYSINTWNFNIFNQFTGAVYKTTSNTQVVDEYTLIDFFINKRILHNINIGFSVNNLLNNAYQIVADRPMPTRNYNFNLKIKI